MDEACLIKTINTIKEEEYLTGFDDKNSKSQSEDNYFFVELETTEEETKQLPNFEESLTKAGSIVETNEKRKQDRLKKQKWGRPKLSNETKREQRREANRRYRQRHPEANREASRRYRAAHPEKSRESSRRYRAAHPEKFMKKRKKKDGPEEHEGSSQGIMNQNSMGNSTNPTGLISEVNSKGFYAKAERTVEIKEKIKNNQKISKKSRGEQTREATKRCKDAIPERNRKAAKRTRAPHFINLLENFKPNHLKGHQALRQKASQCAMDQNMDNFLNPRIFNNILNYEELLDKAGIDVKEKGKPGKPIKQKRVRRITSTKTKKEQPREANKGCRNEHLEKLMENWDKENQLEEPLEVSTQGAMDQSFMEHSVNTQFLINEPFEEESKENWFNIQFGGKNDTQAIFDFQYVNCNSFQEYSIKPEPDEDGQKILFETVNSICPKEEIFFKEEPKEEEVYFTDYDIGDGGWELLPNTRLPDYGSQVMAVRKTNNLIKEESLPTVSHLEFVNCGRAEDEHSQSQSFVSNTNCYPVSSCVKCKLVFSSELLLKRHWETCRLIEIINGDRKFCCHICEYNTTDIGDIEDHLNKHSGKLPHTCDICDKGCISVTQLEVHKRLHSQQLLFKCSLCPYIGPHLEKHMFTKHSGVRSYSCHLCSFKTKQRSILYFHIASHAYRTKYHPYCCPSCDYKASQKDSLTKHMRIHEDKLSSYCCSNCSYETFWRYALKAHMKSHMKRKLHFCPYCAYRSTQKKMLGRHLSTHHK